MGLQDFFTWRTQTTATSPAMADEDLAADVDEPPDMTPRREPPHPDFQKSLVRPESTRKVSLLTKAFHTSPTEAEILKSDIQISNDLARRRSMMSNASLASTAELTSDGGLTSPARTNTPSPPYPSATFTSFAPYSLAAKPTAVPAVTKTVGHPQMSEVLAVSPKALPPIVEAPKRKRCITFMCDGKKEAAAKAKQAEAAIPVVESAPPAPITSAAPKKRCMIQFACPGPKQADKAKSEVTSAPRPKAAEAPKRPTSRSPSVPRKSPRAAPTRSTLHRDSTSTLRQTSQSPVSTRVKPKFIAADEKTLNASEATRFHEFASEKVQDDDWIQKDADKGLAKLTISDTLKKENAIRQLGNEAEAEALEDEEDEDEDEEEQNDSDDENDDEEDDDMDRDSLDGSDEEASDGNETDNEAGFAESDEESDIEGEFAFWTPGRRAATRDSGEAVAYRPSAHRAPSTSSIDSLNHMEPEGGARKLRRRPIKIRPGTPDLPDSTDFVCGTLDEDRPLENAYVSCMKARENAKHKQCPQDIDPSFPTSDPEAEEDEEDEVEAGHDSEEQLWIHGKFEESDDERYGRRRSTTMRRHSPGRLHSPPPPRRSHSPHGVKLRLHSPPPPKQRSHSPPPKQRFHSPPPKQRLRSPPPRKLFGSSPKRMHSPPPAQTVRSPAASPTSTQAIGFAPLGSRPGLTHTKSLPRTPNAFCRQYHASRLIAANGNEGNDIDGHVRGAIDIVRGLEEKRQRRKEKFYQKQSNRKKQAHGERKPQPGKGAERMRELGLLMAGKTGIQDPYMLSA